MITGMKASRLFSTLEQRIIDAAGRNTPAVAMLMLLALSFIAAASRAQISALAAATVAPAGVWTRYACADCIAAIDAGPDAVWVGLQSGGIVRWEPDGSAYQRWTRADGLTGDLAFGVAAAPDGTVWAMTGLFSWVMTDPQGLSRYTPSTGWSAVPLPAWFVVAYPRGMAADADGVWIATSDGLARYEGGTWLRVGASADTLPSADVFDVDVAPDGSVWAATDMGVARFNAAGAWSHMPWPAGTPAYEARWLHVTETGHVWVAVSESELAGVANAGVMHFDGAAWHHYREADGLRSDTVMDITSTADGRVWFAHFAGSTGAVSVWDGSAWGGTDRADGLPSSFISRLATGPDGALWAGSFDSGIGRLEAGAWGHVRTEEGPFSLVTFDIERDGAALWFSHFNLPLSGTSYVARRDASGWREFTAADGLPYVYTLPDAQADAAIDLSGAYWRGVRAPEGAAEAVTLVRFDGSASRLFGPADGLPDEHVRDLASIPAAGADAVWAAFDAGLFVWDGGAWSAADLTGLPSTSLSAVAEHHRPSSFSWIGRFVGSEPDAWLGGTGFVAHGTGLPGRSWTVYLAGPDTGLPYGTIVDIDSLDVGGTWIVTEGGAVARLDGERWTSWPADEVMGGASVHYLYLNGIVADGRGGAWVGGETADGGPTVAHFDGTEWTQYGPADGAPEMAVFDVAIGEDCSVWFAGIAAIVAFTPDGGCPAVGSTPPPTAGPTHSPTAVLPPTTTLVPPPTPTTGPTLAPTAVPPPSPTADPDAPCVCRGLREAVPSMAIDAAIANPDSVSGWGEPRDPGKPVSPYNPLRECLSMRNPASPYHPLYNGLRWSAGCP